MTYFAFKTGKNYCPQVLLDKCKYIVKENEMSKYTTDKLEISSDNEYSDDQNSDEENYIE